MLAYITKEDADPLQFQIDVQQELAAKKAHKRILGKRLLSEPLTAVL